MRNFATSFLRSPIFIYGTLPIGEQARPELDRAIIERVEIGIKYQGYIQRQRAEADHLRDSDLIPLDPGIDYDLVLKLTDVVRQ